MLARRGRTCRPGSCDAFDLIGESFEVLVTVHETRPGNDQIVVVTETFHHPKIRCQDFFLVIEGVEGDGTQALAVHTWNSSRLTRLNSRGADPHPSVQRLVSIKVQSLCSRPPPASEMTFMNW